VTAFCFASSVKVRSRSVLSAIFAILLESYQDYVGGNGVLFYSDAFRAELAENSARRNSLLIFDGESMLCSQIPKRV
jgi:acetylornithine/succinyldiaminopimelate/putrescine aminotransferase